MSCAFFLVAYYAMTKGKQRVEHKFEVLQAERYADDGAAEDYAEREVREGNLDAAEDNPQYIH